VTIDDVARGADIEDPRGPCLALGSFGTSIVIGGHPGHFMTGRCTKRSALAGVPRRVRGSRQPLLGRRTYENFARWWPNAPVEDPVGQYMNAFHKYVVSSTLSEPLTSQNSTLIRDDVPGEIANLRGPPGKDIQVIGSGELVQMLIEHDLVDEYRLISIRSCWAQARSCSGT
jgi:RibD C-terminal domain